MPSFLIKQHRGLEFAWVKVPPPVPKELYWGFREWHEHRKAGHTSSFIAMGLLINVIGKTENEKRFSKDFAKESSRLALQEENYHLLTQSKQICSRSHTHEWACAALSTSPEFHKSVGVDIEPKNRPINSGVQKFYVHRGDATKDLQPIEIWCLKEAIFKASSSFLNYYKIEHSALVLTDIQISVSSKKQAVFSVKGLSGHCGILPEEFGPKGFCTAWATLRE